MADTPRGDVRATGHVRGLLWTEVVVCACIEGLSRCRRPGRYQRRGPQLVWTGASYTTDPIERKPVPHVGLIPSRAMNTTTRSTILGVATGVSALIAVAALAVALVALEKHQADARQIRSLRAQLRSSAPALSQASDSITAAEAKLKALESKVGKVTPEVASIESCLPELQSEFNALEIKGETYAQSYITNSAHTSLACDKVLYTASR